MRKLFLVLAVSLLVSAAYAVDVTISCAQVGDTNEVIISYLADSEANIPRAFSLDITIDNAETIYSVTPLDANYWVYPGSYPGSDPVGSTSDSSDTLPGIDTNGVTIEMGSLHSPPGLGSNPNQPDLGNDLLSIMVTGTSDCNVGITGNAARGKVVLYDATNEDDGVVVVYTGCQITGRGALCPGDVTATITGLVTGPPPLFLKSFDINLWEGPDGKTDTYDVQSLLYLLQYAGTSMVVTPVPTEALAGDVTATVTGLVTGPPPLFLKSFDMNLWEGPDGKVDTYDVQSLLYLLQYAGTAMVYTCP